MMNCGLQAPEPYNNFLRSRKHLQRGFIQVSTSK